MLRSIYCNFCSLNSLLLARIICTRRNRTIIIYEDSQFTLWNLYERMFKVIYAAEAKEISSPQHFFPNITLVSPTYLSLLTSTRFFILFTLLLIVINTQCRPTKCNYVKFYFIFFCLHMFRNRGLLFRKTVVPSTGTV